MKVVVIADLHGRDLWKQQVQEDADMYIFLGDYFDSFDIDGQVQIENFREVVEFYQNNKDKVVLLAGNHDISYIDVNCACSGYQNKYAYEIGKLIKPLRENGDLKACKVINKHIFVHAGITQTWIKDNNIDLNNLEKEVNELFQKNIEPFCFQNDHKISRYVDPYGDDIFQSPMWVRPYSLMVDQVDGFKQVVGHTGTRKGVVYNEDHGVYMTDCQDNSIDFLILEL